jgi:hypothetical protein
MQQPPPKRPIKSLADLPGRAPATGAYAKPSPKVSRQTKAKLLTPAEKAAFLASRPDLKPKS